MKNKFFKSWPRRALCVLTSLCLLSGNCAPALAEATGAAEETLEASAEKEPVFYSHNGRVTMIDGDVATDLVTDFDAAKAVIDGVLDQLGGDETTELDPWRDLTDAHGNRYYVFRQMYNNTTVIGGAVKVITDAEGKMLGLTSCIEALPEEEEVTESISAEEAEQIVKDHAAKTTQQDLTVLEGMTNRIIVSTILEVDISDQDAVPTSHYVWAVYTDNPSGDVNQSVELPYLTHYVTMEGEYLYSIPNIMPGDEAGQAGFDSSYVFEFMEPVDYTGYVDLSTGEEKEISVTVMRDKRTGMYYLGNIERRIVVGDCWEFLYGGNRIVLESSRDNLQWNQVGLLTLYNYCRAYDYYKEIGWIGPDGKGTPILVLNNYCDINHKSVDNAAYAGGYLGWQIFLASEGNDFGQCLDILAHEFTHGVTDSTMTYNSYINDYGAINEAISDIQGKTCQMMMDGVDTVSWTLGDKSIVQARSMEEPYTFGQPKYTWDIYYVPKVKTPTMLNDYGGVHTNSSLLNYLAFLLYEKGGMTLEEGRSFWFTVDCAAVPATDYEQMAELLPWALRATGLEKYDEALTSAFDETRLGKSDLPESFEEDRSLITLSLPENEYFDDEQWVMFIMTLDVDKLVENIKGIAGHLMQGDFSDLPELFQDLILDVDASFEEPVEEEPAEEKGFFELFLEELEKQFEEEEATKEQEEESFFDEEELKQALIKWIKGIVGPNLYNANTNGGQDGHTMRSISLPGYCLPVLMHGIYKPETESTEENGILVYLGGKWIDVGNIINKKASETEDVKAPDEVKELINLVLSNIFNIRSINDVMDLIFIRVEGGSITEIPADGLAEITPLYYEDENPIADTEESAEAEPKMSRPKLETEEEAVEAETEVEEEAAEAVVEVEEEVVETEAEVEEEAVEEGAEALPDAA